MEKIKLNLRYEDLKEFINTVSSFESDIDLIKDNYIVDAKSIMGIFSLDFTKDTFIKINSDNENEIKRFKESIKKFE